MSSLKKRYRRNSPDGGTGGAPRFFSHPPSMGDQGGWTIIAPYADN
jgi:hypothetical protein